MTERGKVRFKLFGTFRATRGGSDVELKDTTYCTYLKLLLLSNKQYLMASKDRALGDSEKIRDIVDKANMEPVPGQGGRYGFKAKTGLELRFRKGYGLCLIGPDFESDIQEFESIWRRRGDATAAELQQALELYENGIDVSTWAKDRIYLGCEEWIMQRRQDLNTRCADIYEELKEREQAARDPDDQGITDEIGTEAWLSGAVANSVAELSSSTEPRRRVEVLSQPSSTPEADVPKAFRSEPGELIHENGICGETSGLDSAVSEPESVTESSTSLGYLIREELRASKAEDHDPQPHLILGGRGSVDEVGEEREEPSDEDQVEPSDTVENEVEVSKENEARPPVEPFVGGIPTEREPPAPSLNVIDALATELNWSYADVVTTLESARTIRSEEGGHGRRRQMTTLGALTILVVLVFGIGLGRFFPVRTIVQSDHAQQPQTTSALPQSPSSSQPSKPKAKTPSSQGNAASKSQIERASNKQKETASQPDESNVVHAVPPENPIFIKDLFVKHVEGNQPDWRTDDEVIAGQLFSPYLRCMGNLRTTAVYKLGGQFSTFTCVIGVADWRKNEFKEEGAAVEFHGDGVRLRQFTTQIGVPIKVRLRVAGVQSLAIGWTPPVIIAEPKVWR